MASIICVLGRKGGTGKTTLSHMLAHGFGLYGHPTLAVLTDAYRERLAKQGRSYLPFDAREPKNLKRVTDTMQSAPGWFAVIDGGSSDRNVDLQLATVADLVLLPFRDSHEDLRMVREDLARFPQAWAVPSQWPGNPWAQAAAWRSVEQILGDQRQRLLEPVFSIGASKLLLQHQVPASLPSMLNHACRALVGQIAPLLGCPHVLETAGASGLRTERASQAHAVSNVAEATASQCDRDATLVV